MPAKGVARPEARLANEFAPTKTALTNPHRAQPGFRLLAGYAARRVRRGLSGRLSARLTQ